MVVNGAAPRDRQKGRFVDSLRRHRYYHADGQQLVLESATSRRFLTFLTLSLPGQVR